MQTKVLVVDDEIDTLNLLRTLLEISDFDVVTTLNSVDAITLAEIEKPDVVLLDIMMPKLDGFALCKMMRENPLTKNLPIIFVTAYNALDLDDRKREVGADYILNKPINIDLLIEAIHQTHAARKQMAETGNGQAADKKPAPTEKAKTQAESSVPQQQKEDEPAKQDKAPAKADSAQSTTETEDTQAESKPVETKPSPAPAPKPKPKPTSSRKTTAPKPKKPPIPTESSSDL